MMMNSILGFEAGSVGKMPAATGESSKKSSSSNDFADLVAAQSGPEDAAEEAVAGKSEVAEAEAGTESQAAQTEAAETGIDEPEARVAEASGEVSELEAGLPEAETNEGLAGTSTDQDSEEAAVAEAQARPDSDPKAAGEKVPHGSSSVAEGADQLAKSERVSGVERPSRENIVTGQPVPPSADGTQQADGAAVGQNPAAAGGGQTETSEEIARIQAPGQTQAEAVSGRNTAERGEKNADLKVPQGTEGSGTTRVPEEASVKAALVANAQPPTGQQQSGTAPGQVNKGVAAAGQAPAVPYSAMAIPGSQSLQPDGQQAAIRPDGAAQLNMPAAQGIVQALTAGQTAPKGPGQRAESAVAALTGDVPADADAGETGRAFFSDLKSGEFRAPAAAPAPNPQRPAVSVLQPPIAGGLGAGSAGAELLSGSEDSLQGAFGLSGEVPGLTQLLAEASFGTGTVHRPETPRMIAAQLAEAFAAKGEQKVEVSLNPQELGHVKMRVVASETGITMIIQTERPETADLMRRHIHELAEEFRRMGYEDISFEFSGGQTGGQSADDAGGGGASSGGTGPRGADAADGTEQVIQNLRLGETGVDMRV
ncbi:flagellar hook-length control protein FliK [Leisingera aquaemixtae]|uniref:Flagellar hook-length control protein FliK n=1 Tax=Leisingera aquaemixtae TaxID=1396826 RepID=A0A0P1HDK2_9RHOB|nr:flagellar hook-length control protein FliK [Leisingera aquaemixtae]CUI01493.1 Flagellar hook-length control protein FliK [Leisingera aquaemixtae]